MNKIIIGQHKSDSAEINQMIGLAAGVMTTTMIILKMQGVSLSESELTDLVNTVVKESSIDLLGITQSIPDFDYSHLKNELLKDRL